MNAMAIWSRFIDTAMEGMSEFVLCYADDVLVYTKSTSVDDHVRDVEKVLQRLERYGIKVKASKLKLGLKEMPFLGVIITKDGLKPNPEKVQAIAKMQPPRNIKQLRSVVGMFASENLSKDSAKSQHRCMNKPKNMRETNATTKELSFPQNLWTVLKD